MYELEAEVAGLTGGGMVSATAPPVPERHGWGALLRRHAASIGR
jgi:hypothetical protein